MNITVNQVLLLYVIMMSSVSNCRSILTELTIVMVVIYEKQEERIKCNGVVMSIKQSGIQKKAPDNGENIVTNDLTNPQVLCVGFESYLCMSPIAIRFTVRSTASTHRFKHVTIYHYQVRPILSAFNFDFCHDSYTTSNVYKETCWL